MRLTGDIITGNRAMATLKCKPVPMVISLLPAGTILTVVSVISAFSPCCANHFKLQEKPGNYILWRGDPYDATINDRC